MRECLLSIKKQIIQWAKKVKLRWIILSVVLFIPVTIKGIVEKIIPYFSDGDYKDKLQGCADFCNAIKNLIPSYVRWTIGALIILFWILLLYCRLMYKEKNVIVLGHSTMGKVQFKFRESFMNGRNIQTEELDLIDDFIGINGKYNNIHYIVKKQDEFLNGFVKKINQTDSYGYAGVAHSPLIARAGFRLGDESSYIIFHKKRDNGNEFFEELNEDTDYSNITIEKKEIKEYANELIVAISTTFPILDNSFNILRPDQNSVIKFTTAKQGFDMILSKNQVDSYIRTILSEVRQIVNENDIKKIHVIISSSVAFTFALGRSFSKHHDAEVIVYHYDKNTEGKYPWGISLFKDFSDCMVIPPNLSIPRSAQITD